VAAAVIFPEGIEVPGVNDSKKLTTLNAKTLLPDPKNRWLQELVFVNVI
jgi:ribonuclease HII